MNLGCRNSELLQTREHFEARDKPCIRDEAGGSELHVSQILQQPDRLGSGENQY